MLLRELHAAWRRLVRQPGYAALSVAVLGVGLGVVVPVNLLADPGLHTRAHDAAVLLPVMVLVAGIALLSSLLPVVRALRVVRRWRLRYE
jgi:putative ABC transport system permease protein